MLWKNNYKYICAYIGFSLVLALASIPPVFAYVMESQNYRLELDEIDMGAIGEMRDFSGFSQGKNSNPGEGQIVLFSHKISSREIILGSLLALLLLAFVCYFVLKKRLFFKQ